MHEHLSRGYGQQLDLLTATIRGEWRWPSPNAGFASYLATLSGVGLPRGCDVTAPAPEWVARLDEAPLLGAVGFALALDSVTDQETVSAWRRGAERLRFRNPFTGDRESFVYRPCDLLGVSLGAAHCPELDPAVPAWLRQTLERAESELVGGGVIGAVLGAWAADAVGVGWRSVHLPALRDLDPGELALAYWTVALRGKLLTEPHPDLETLRAEIARRYALTQVSETDVARAFLLYSSLHASVEAMLGAAKAGGEGGTQLAGKGAGVPEPLKSALRNRTATVVVGAGVSRAAAGLKGWADVLRAAIAFLQERGETGRALTTVEPLMEEGLYEEAAQVVEHFMTKFGAKADFLRREFHLEPSAIPDRALLQAVWRVAGGTLFTTNYDRLLEIGGPAGVETVTWREPTKMLAALRGGTAVVHLHGVYNDADSVVFSAGNYVRLAEDEAYRGFSQALWTRGPFLFVGTSPAGVGDMDFSRLFAWGKQIVPHLSFVSYMLQPVGAISPEEKRRLYTDCKVEIIEYGSSHSDLGPFLTHMAPGQQ